MSELPLHPRSGRRLPPELRPDAVLARAEGLEDGVLDSALPELLSRIDDGAPIHTGQRVTVWTEGAELFHAMRAAIGEAREEVLLESYVFHDDDTGRFLREALVAAAGRGVRVRVLADSWGTLTTRAGFWQKLREAEVELRFFHPLLRQPWYHPFRDHRKILTVDRLVGFTGGMNIRDHYGAPCKEQSDTWRDTHCRVRGTTAREMAAVFAEGWERAGGDPLDGDLSLEAPSAREPQLGEPEDARILVLESRPGRGHLETVSALTALAGAARRRLWVTNAYFAPRRRAVEILCRTARRGVDVRLLLPGTTDVPPARHAGHAWYRRLLERGVRIWEYQPVVLHAKTLVADGYASVIGSTNLDFRSFRFNAECNLVILDDETGSALTESFETDLERSREIGLADWRRRPVVHRAGDRLARWLAPLL